MDDTQKAIEAALALYDSDALLDNQIAYERICDNAPTWLCQQHDKIADQQAVIAQQAAEIERLNKDNQNFMQNLEWYANEENWWMDALGFVDLSIAEKDGGERARQALGGNGWYKPSK